MLIVHIRSQFLWCSDVKITDSIFKPSCCNMNKERHRLTLSLLLQLGGVCPDLSQLLLMVFTHFLKPLCISPLSAWIQSLKTNPYNLYTQNLLFHKKKLSNVQKCNQSNYYLPFPVFPSYISEPQLESNTIKNWPVCVFWANSLQQTSSAEETEMQDL